MKRSSHFVITFISALPILMSVHEAQAQSPKPTIELALSQGPKVSMIDKIRDEFEKSTGITLQPLNQEGMGGTNVVLAVDSGKAEVGISAFDRELALASIEKSGNKLKHKDKLRFALIGKETTHFVLHPGIPKKALSGEELGKILSGEIKNWKELGGPDVEIQIAFPARFTATQGMLVANFTGGKSLRPLKLFQTFEEISNFVAKTPGAIGIGSPPVMTDNVGKPKHPPMDRLTWFVTLGEPSPNAEKFLKFIQSRFKIAN